MTFDLLRDFFSYFDGGQHTICNFYASTEMLDVTFAAFKAFL